MLRLTRAGGVVAEPLLMSAEALADILVEARLEDVVIIDLACFEDQRVSDTLIVASGRSVQHAHAGMPFPQ